MNNPLADFHFDLELDSVLNFMGYADPSKARKRIVLTAQEAMSHANEHADSWGQAIEVPLCGIDGEIIKLKCHDNTQVELKSSQLPKILRKASAIVILLVTAGQKITDESRSLMAEGKMSQALAVSATGSAMVVDLMKALTDQIFDYAQSRGLGTTLRVGPGYTGWHLEDQATLFDFYDRDLIPVTLSHGIMMEPEKSLMGIVGLVPGGKQAPEIEPCRICDLNNCDMRKAPFRGYDGQGSS
jgi:hypothetical protein